MTGLGGVERGSETTPLLPAGLPEGRGEGYGGISSASKQEGSPTPRITQGNIKKFTELQGLAKGTSLASKFGSLFTSTAYTTAKANVKSFCDKTGVTEKTMEKLVKYSKLEGPALDKKVATMTSKAENRLLDLDPSKLRGDTVAAKEALQGALKTLKNAGPEDLKGALQNVRVAYDKLEEVNSAKLDKGQLEDLNKSLREDLMEQCGVEDHDYSKLPEEIGGNNDLRHAKRYLDMYQSGHAANPQEMLEKAAQYLYKATH